MEDFMNFDIDWQRLSDEDMFSSTAEAKATLTKNELILIFHHKDAEYGYEFSGRINLALHRNPQTIRGVYQDKKIGKTIETPYELTGLFVEDSWQEFEGNWTEGGEIFQFTAICTDEFEVALPAVHKLKIVENDTPTQEETIEAENAIEIETPITNRFTKRQRAARSDARVRTIQRKIELQYGLPRGSVKLCNPDRSIISPLAKIGTFRERWE